MKTPSLTSLFVVAGLLFLAACGGGEKPEGEAAEEAEETAEETAGPESARSAAAGETAVTGGEAEPSIAPHDSAPAKAAGDAGDAEAAAGEASVPQTEDPSEVVAASTSGGEAMTGSQEAPAGEVNELGQVEMVGPADYRDDHLALELSEGMALRAEPENRTYLAVEDQTEIYLIKVEQEAVSEETLEEIADIARQSTLESLGVVTETPGSEVTSTVIDVGEVEGRDVPEGKGKAFAFTFTTEAKEGEQTGKAVTTMGYGNLGGTLLWFQHTGPQVEKHPAAAIDFLGRLKLEAMGKDGDANEVGGEKEDAP